MAAPYIHTPATERGDATTLSTTHHPLDFSFAQPFGSPSKDPAQNLRDHMKGMRSNSNKNVMQTPRVRHALVDRSRAHLPNGTGVGKQEFTPLLKSAQRNRALLRGIKEEEKENNGSGRTVAGNVPDTPAVFRSSYASEEGTQLPGQCNSSMVSIAEDDEETRGSGERGDVGPPPGVESSSMLSSTPIPTLRGGGGTAVLDQGNVLTLRDQEAKLDQIQKDNFGLKLKIHFLEEALRKTGTAFQQATLKENVELKTDKLTLEQELKRQRKRLQDAAHELEEYRAKYEEYLRWVQKRRESRGDEDGEVEKLQRLAEESQKIADERERELDEVRRQLDEAERVQEARVDQEAERLRDDIQDLEAEIREKDRQIEERDERLEALQEKLQEARRGDEEEVRNLREDVEELENELREKDEEIDGKNTKIAELEERINSAYDREKSTKKLRGDVAELEARVREKEEALDESGEQIRALEKRLQTAESGQAKQRREQEQEIQALQQKLQSLEAVHAAALRQRDDELRNVQRELTDKDGEITALQERLQTARGSWDADARETDARLQEKDRVIQEREARLREKSRVVEERDDELADLQKRLRAAEAQHEEQSRAQSQQIRAQGEQIRDLQEKMLAATAAAQAKLQEKDGLIQAREAEMKMLQSRIDAMQSGEKSEVRQKMERIRELETALKQQEQVAKEQLQQNTSLQARLGAMETPSKKDGLLAQQAEQLRVLQQRVHQIEREKDGELDELDRQLQELETQNAALHATINDLRQRSETAEREHSLLGHREEEVRRQQSQVDALEAEVEQLRSALQNAVEQRQSDVRHLESEIDILRATEKTKMEETERRLMREHEAARQDLQDEILVLEAGLDEVEAQKSALESRVRELEASKEQSTPVRERDGLRQKLHALEAERDGLRNRIEELERDLLAAKTSTRDAEARSARLQSRVEMLEADLADERTMAGERMDLHARLKRASIEAEELRIQLSAAEAREAERKGSSSGHARREAELRAHLREAKVELERVQIDLAEKDARMQALVRSERELRARVHDADDAGGARLAEAEARIRELKRQVQVSARREAELRRELQQQQQPPKKVDEEATAKRHAGELRGLAKQIQCLRARCAREEVFRRDLIHTKQFFVKQVQMYHQCNQADLQLLSAMGISTDEGLPPPSKKRSLKAVGLAVRACVRVRRLQVAWAQERRVQDAIVRKLEGMRKGSTRSSQAVGRV